MQCVTDSARVLPHTNLDSVLFERVAGGALQLGNGLVEFGLRAQFVAACGGELRLALKHEKDRRLASVELGLLGAVLVLRGGARRARRAQTRLSRPRLLQGVAHVNLYELLQLLALRADALLVHERAPVLRLRRRVAERQIG